MRNNIVDDAFFWKQLADKLLENLDIDKEMFYKKIEPVKAVWDIRGIQSLSKDIKRASQNKTSYIKTSFSEIIHQFKK